MATKANIVIDQGTTFSTTMNLTDQNNDMLNLNGFTANATMKKWYTSTNSVSFTCSVNTSTGTVTLVMNAPITANLYPGRYVYDVTLTNTIANTISRVVEGIVTVTPGVTGTLSEFPEE